MEHFCDPVHRHCEVPLFYRQGHWEAKQIIRGYAVVKEQKQTMNSERITLTCVFWESLVFPYGTCGCCSLLADQTDKSTGKTNQLCWIKEQNKRFILVEKKMSFCWQTKCSPRALEMLLWFPKLFSLHQKNETFGPEMAGGSPMNEWVRPLIKAASEGMSGAALQVLG